MIIPIDLSIDELEVYRLLYSKVDFETFLVQYTLDQLALDSDKKLLLTKKKVSGIINRFVFNGFIKIVDKGVKGKPTTYKIIKLNQERIGTELGTNRERIGTNTKQIVIENIGIDSISGTNKEQIGIESERIGNELVPPISNSKSKSKNNIIYSDNHDLNSCILSFIEMRKTLKKPMTNCAIEMLVNKLSKLSDDENIQIDIINRSIMNSWTDVYEIKDKKKNINDLWGDEND